MNDLEALTPDGITVEEAMDREYIWRILIWGEPGTGKSHFSWSMPKPLAFIDTEGKADVIVHKFDLDSERVRLWQPDDFDDAMEAIDQALAFLDYWRSETGETGTIVVDSMSVMWHHAQLKHISHAYMGRDMDPSELKSGFGGGTSDWVPIKRYHNKEFRNTLLESPYHLCWTAMSEEDYSRKFNEDLDVVPEKPAGEKENVYKATDVIRLEKDDKGRTVARLEKAGLIRHKYAGLEYPTFDRHQTTVREIEQAELNDVEPEDAGLTHDVRVSLGDARYEDNE